MFTASDVADPFYLNLPEYLLDDAQINGEYVAYAIKYISVLAKRNASLVTWSQGTHDANIGSWASSD